MIFFSYLIYFLLQKKKELKMNEAKDIQVNEDLMLVTFSEGKEVCININKIFCLKYTMIETNKELIRTLFINIGQREITFDIDEKSLRKIMNVFQARFYEIKTYESVFFIDVKKINVISISEQIPHEFYIYFDNEKRVCIRLSNNDDTHTEYEKIKTIIRKG
jgi:hypothetical protein